MEVMCISRENLREIIETSAKSSALPLFCCFLPGHLSKIKAIKLPGMPKGLCWECTGWLRSVKV
jgi:hypothetical protein